MANLLFVLFKKIEEMSALEDGFKVENIHEFL